MLINFNHSENQDFENKYFLELKAKADNNYYEDPQSVGTEGYHRLSAISRILFTDGVAEMVIKKECHWLADTICSYQKQFNSPDNEFFGIYLIKTEGNACEFIVTDGNDNVLIRQEIEYTDLDCNVKLYMAASEIGPIVMLPSEY